MVGEAGLNPSLPDELLLGRVRHVGRPGGGVRAGRRGPLVARVIEGHRRCRLGSIGHGLPLLPLGTVPRERIRL